MIFSAIKKIFGSTQSADNMVDGIIKAGDALFFTPEEKSVANAKGFELYIEYQKATMPQNASRRFIAKSVTLLWLFLIILGVIVKGIGIVKLNVDMTDFSDYIFEMLKDNVNVPFGIIVVFYFVKRMMPNAT